MESIVDRFGYRTTFNSRFCLYIFGGGGGVIGLKWGTTEDITCSRLCPNRLVWWAGEGSICKGDNGSV